MQNEARIPIEYVGRVSTVVPPSILEEFASHRLYFALRRFRDQVRRVTVRLVDENGPRGGVDSRCVVTVEFHHGESIVVEATTAWPTASMTAAAKRVNEVIRRRHDRESSRSRRGGGRLSRVAA